MILKIAKHCPRWSSCSVNNCPLEPNQKHPADREQKCDMRKSVRRRIALQFPGKLPLEGLTPGEWAAKQRFESIPVALRVQMAERGREALKRHKSAKSTINQESLAQ